MSSEAEIHFELYRHLKNTIQEEPEFHGMKFGDVLPEFGVDGGFADIVVKDEMGRPFLVIEAKRKTDRGFDRNLDPYSPKVIEQAFGYAGALGSEYFATYNGSQLVLFRTYELGVPLLERRARAYGVTDPRQFAPELLKQVAGIKRGTVKWEPKSRTFIKRLKSFHERLGGELEEKLGPEIKNSEFEKNFENWITRQGWDVERKESETRFVNQAAYLLMNKLFFYKILEDTGHDVPKLLLKDLADPGERREAFKSIVEEVDFEPIYEHDPIFDEIPLTERASLEVGEFLEELDRYDLGKFKHDTIGHIYEDVIPPDVRHDLGQYYTPPEIVELITKLTIESPDDEVLDPGCGSGTFLITAYNILRDLKEENGESVEHADLLGRVYGIDVNRFPAHLTAINLALQDLGARTEKVNVEVQDFFNVWPDQERLAVERVDPYLAGRGTGSWGEMLNVPPRVDVVIANPPYIRQEIIPDKELCRKHLERLGFEDMSDRSDIYVYFFTHATEFLRENGRVGFITSDKWLTVGYGEDLQEFFLDNYRIKAIISFSKRVFEAPLVPTCVTILERTGDKSKRDPNIAKFLRVKAGIELDEIIDVVESDYDPDTIQDKEKYRLITKKQEELREAGKWNRFLYAPPIYWKLLNHEKICRLGDVAEVRRGKTTGANDFFYLKKDEAESWNIDDRFLRPVAKSIRQTDTVEFTKDNTGLLVIDVHEYVAEKLKDISEDRIGGVKLDGELLPRTTDLKELSPEEEYILKCLHEDGYDGLFRYIVNAMWEKDWGRNNPPHERPTCKQHRSQNKCWFNLGKLKIPDLMIPETCWKRVFTIINKDKLVADRNLYELYTDKFDEVLADILNSSMHRLFREIHGRITGGGANRFVVYEAVALPILDPRKLSREEEKKIIDSGKEMIKRKKIDSNKLNRSVLSPLDAEDRVEEISAYAEALSKARREGKEVGEMISGIEEEEVGELEGAEIVSEGIGQKKLTEF